MPFPVSSLARYELRRFRGLMPKVALVFVLIVPLLYAAIYLSANWNPYGKLSHLPVAVVNADQPATARGKTVDAGRDLVANLHASNAFDWHDEDAAAATRGLEQGTYYLVLTIPSDFSAHLVSGAGDDPQRAKIELRRNDANGFVVGSVTNSAQNTIARAVDASAEESYFNAVYANLATIRHGLAEAADGSGDLADGLIDAHTGAGKLGRGSAGAVQGARDLQTGASRLATGLDSAKTGANSLSSGLTKLDGGSADLSSGARKVANGTQQLVDGVVPPLTTLEKTLPEVGQNAKAAADRLSTISDDLAGRTDSVASDLGQASDLLATVKRDHPKLAYDPAFKRLSDRVDSASDRAADIGGDARRAASTIDTIRTTVDDAGDVTGKVSSLKNNVISLNRGAHQVADGAASLHTGIDTASTGAKTLATGLVSADSGARRLASGSATLAGGLTTLHDGAVSLDGGLQKLSNGAGTLHAELEKGAKRIPAVTADQQADAVQVLSSPADVTTVIDNAATYYGRGLAPLFLSIALWVFGISVFLVVRPVSGRLLAGRANPVRLALAAWAPVAAVAVLAGWLMVGTVWVFLDLHPTHPALILVAVTLGAMCFSAIAHLLRVALGTAGSSLLLVLLILQLCASGGTYPAPLLPRFFAAIGPYLPLTYLIDAYRVAISGGLLTHYLRDVAVLAGVLVVVLGLLVVTVRKRQQFTIEDLHPPLTAP